MIYWVFWKMNIEGPTFVIETAEEIVVNAEVETARGVVIETS